jgi:hypothetical protein
MTGVRRKNVAKGGSPVSSPSGSNLPELIFVMPPVEHGLDNLLGDHAEPDVSKARQPARLRQDRESLIPDPSEGLVVVMLPFPENSSQRHVFP